MTVCSIQQCLTGARHSKRVGARLRMWRAPVVHPMLWTQTRVKVNQMVQCDCHVMLQHISEHLGFSVEHVNCIITQVLGCWKVPAVWVPKSWIDKQKVTHVGICLEHLLQYERQGDKFLYHIVVGDKFWCLHFDPETKHMNQHWKHSSSFWLTKNHTTLTAGKVMLTMSFNHCGPLLIDWLLKGITVSASCYDENLEPLRSTIKVKTWHVIMWNQYPPWPCQTLICKNTCRSCSCFSDKFFDVPPTVQMCPPVTIMY